jgi:glycosyltransferase involved in cell wall biosynthesis
MALELTKRLPGCRLTVIGGGRDVSKLREEVRDAGLDPCVEVCGFVEKITDVLGRLAKAGVAIAPYYPFDANSFTFFSDPGKIKVYLGCGIPVVLTDVPPIAKEIDREGAGRIADYYAVEFAKAIVSVMQSEAYEDIRNRARMMGERFAWPHVLTSAFMRLEP